MLSCQEVSRFVSESLDRELPLGQRLRVRIHLLMCRFCSRFRRQVLFLRDAARRYLTMGEGMASLFGTDLSPEARERIKRSLKPGST
jgi:hypothetical protein